jgi:L-sorbose 1-phosphate reductase
MGVAPGGKMAILAGAGPMGLGAIDYALHAERNPSLLVVSDVDESRLERARSIFSVGDAAARGIKLVFLNTAKAADPVAELRAQSGGTGYDDVFVFAPVAEVVRQGDLVLGRDGCLNFFAGPTDAAFTAPVNFYDVHYASTHIVGTTGGNTADMIESLEKTAGRLINPAVMVTHVGGLDSAAEATLHLPDKPAGKKLVYTGISLEMTAIADFSAKAAVDPRFVELSAVCARHRGLWNAEAERYLLANWS